MILGIDASNIRDGGGVTHLRELLRGADPGKYGFERVVVWGPRNTLGRLEPRPWLVTRTEPVLERQFLPRALWQRNHLGRLLSLEKCRLLFVPGGSFATDFRPVVTMSQNLLPFEWTELLRSGMSGLTAKLMLLRFQQSRSIKAADGTIFLSKYAEQTVTKVTGRVHGPTVVIPHGIDERFRLPPRKQRPLAEYSRQRPFSLLYVSVIHTYKHQWRVAKAVAALRAKGLPVSLDLIGPGYAPALRKLMAVLQSLDPGRDFLRYHGPIEHAQLPSRYAEADCFVFASSCENMPNILLEGMASGLPIASSNRGPMPEVLGDCGLYFDPEDSSSIESVLQALIESRELRAEKANLAFAAAQNYSWARCAHATFQFLSRAVKETTKSGPGCGDGRKTG